MIRNLFPRRDIFFVYFEKHAALSYQAAQHLVQILNSQQRNPEMFQTIKKLENEADSIAHQCVETLHKTFITPMDRMDIHHLITTLDDVTDEIEDIAKLIILYKLENLCGDAIKLSEILLSSVQQVFLAVKELRKMQMTDEIRNHFFNINHLENEADVLLNQALGRLFEEENDTKTLIKWKEVYEHLEKATDVCEDVSNILEGIILENE